MGCRNREFSGEERAVQASLSDALLFTTMCIIGLPVDVHVKDGSIYSGIFHTACLENDYGVVLKRARMTKKGNFDANVASGDVIETLVVVSKDLVQVVAKGILLPSNGVACNFAGDHVGDIADTIPSLECADREVKMEKSSKTNTDRMQTSRTRRTPHTENGITHRFAGTKVCHVGNPLEVEHGKSIGIRPVKKDEASSALVNGRQVGDGRSQGKQFDYEAKFDFQKKEPVCGDNLHPRTNLTEFYQDLANSEKALECLRRVLQIDGRFTKAYYLLLHGMGEHRCQRTNFLPMQKITNYMKKLEKVSAPLFTGLSAFLRVD